LSCLWSKLQDSTLMLVKKASKNFDAKKSQNL
jgi:hypothetical protein